MITDPQSITEAQYVVAHEQGFRDGLASAEAELQALREQLEQERKAVERWMRRAESARNQRDRLAAQQYLNPKG